MTNLRYTLDKIDVVPSKTLKNSQREHNSSELLSHFQSHHFLNPIENANQRIVIIFKQR
jgi:hypothetical protein